jgi:RNA polymerase sigma-70 factor (ECF subfamily)
MDSWGQAELEALYTRLEKPLYNVVYRTIWDREEAHDVVQEAFVRLWAMRRRIDRESVEPLAYRIALNLARSLRRKRRIRTMLGFDRLAGAFRDPGDVESDLLRGERDARVRRGIEALPAEVREVVLLTSFTDLGYREIAESLRIPEGTVGSRRNRGLRMLRERLVGAPDERPE